MNVDSNHNPFLLSGTRVVDGHGKMLASIGKNIRGGYCQITNGIKWRFFEEMLLPQWLEMFRPLERRVISVVALLLSFIASRMRFQNGSRVFNGGNRTMLDNVVYVLRDCMGCSNYWFSCNIIPSSCSYEPDSGLFNVENDG